MRNTLCVLAFLCGLFTFNIKADGPGASGYLQFADECYALCGFLGTFPIMSEKGTEWWCEDGDRRMCINAICDAECTFGPDLR